MGGGRGMGEVGGNGGEGVRGRGGIYGGIARVLTGLLCGWREGYTGCSLLDDHVCLHTLCLQCIMNNQLRG